MDYLFVTDKGVLSRSDAGADADLPSTLKVLVINDSFSTPRQFVQLPYLVRAPTSLLLKRLLPQSFGLDMHA